MPTHYKLTAAVLILAAAIVHLLNTGYRDWNAGGDSAYVIALGLLFFSRERIEDERVRELKFKAVTVGFFIGYVMTFASKLWLRFAAQPDLPRTMSAYDMMFVVLVAATAFFHFWRIQDGRDTIRPGAP